MCGAEKGFEVYRRDDALPRVLACEKRQIPVRVIPLLPYNASARRSTKLLTFDVNYGIIKSLINKNL